MRVKNLNQLFTEFKKYHETKKNVANEKNFYSYIDTIHSVTESTGSKKLAYFALKLGDKQLGFVYPADLECSFWQDIYLAKIEKVLKDIWATGQIQATYGLDLSWPANQQSKTNQETSDNNNKPIENPKLKLSDKVSELEKQNQELRTKIKQLEKKKKLYWTIGSLVFISLVGLMVWLTFKKAKKLV